MNKLLEQIGTLQIKKLVYPAITSAFAITVLVLVIFTGRFLTSSIDRTFRLDEKTVQSQLVELDLESLEPVEKKLGI